MTLRKKTLLISGMTLVGLIGVLYTTSSTILLGGFAKVEEQDTRHIVKGVLNVLKQTQDDFSSSFVPWSAWDDTYNFIEDANARYVESNLLAKALANSKVNLALYVHSSGRIVFGTGFDLKNQKKTPIPEVLRHLSPNDLLLQHPNPYSRLTGIVLLPEGPMVITSQPIVTSIGEGPIRGTVIFGRYLDAEAIENLARITDLSLTTYRLDDAQMPTDFQVVRSSLANKTPILVRPLNEQTIAGYTLLTDIYGKPALILRVDVPRTIYKQGQASIRYLILSILVVGLVFSLATLLLLEKLVLSRLFRLSANVRSIGTSGDLSGRVLSLNGRDELASLANTINTMLEALEHSQQQQRKSEERYHRHNTVLAELARRKILDFGDLHASLSEITEAAAHTLEVGRVSVWLYNDQRSKMHCIELYERSTGQHSEGIELAAARYAVYFRALEEKRTLAVRHTQLDPRTKELSELYLSPLGVTSMLDASIWVGGQMVGIVCHEHVGATRHWSLEEQNFAASIADLVSLAIEAYERKRSQEALRKAHDELEIRVRERTAELALINEELQAEITERKIAEAKLIHEAVHDSLTGLPNRTLFRQRLGRAIERAQRLKDYFFAVLFLDLDRFKLVNDSLGHLIGDQLLIAFVRRVEQCLRSTDTVARLGGDEFAILLDDINDINDATQIADRIQKALTLPFNLSGYEVFISTSIGIALSTTGYEQPEELLRDADTVMYRAKALGKARHEVFDKAMHTRAVTLLQLDNDLRRALERQELQIHYQPIVLLKTGRITGFEALVRWQHPIRGLVSPAEFVPLAEETGLIVPIGGWVLREACSQMRAWQEQFFTTSPLTLSVNFSGKQFSQPNLIEQIEQILQETGFDVHSLKLEITESVLIENAEAAAAMLSQLRSLGVQIYMDDFGTGYSSLSYLHRFPVDVLKIDRAFISRIGVDLELVRAIITMAHNLNMNVVAEGIETPEQLTQLIALQCEYGQGYLFSKPLNREGAGALIDKTLSGLPSSTS
jgi:diguanylate cyclase (GGDEF)-like protein